MRSLSLLLLLPLSTAFAPAAFAPRRAVLRALPKDVITSDITEDIVNELLEEETIGYSAGTADHPFAKRFAPSASMDIPTVSDAMAIFSSAIGFPVSPLFRNAVSDLVATTHLTIVDARFKYDPMWALGFATVNQKLLDSYPDPGGAEKIAAALAVSARMDPKKLGEDADGMRKWLEGKSEAEVKAALKGEGGSALAEASKMAREDEFWLYSKFFGIGLFAAMEAVGVEPTAENVQAWLGDCMGKGTVKAVTDLDAWKGLQSKMQMMTQLMKEIEIREKKKLADRLEEKAKVAMARAEREAKAKAEVDDKI